jgi:hypothetical protein
LQNVYLLSFGIFLTFYPRQPYQITGGIQELFPKSNYLDNVVLYHLIFNSSKRSSLLYQIAIKGQVNKNCRTSLMV